MTQIQGSILCKDAGLSPITITAADGATAGICPHGAHVVSWKPAGLSERLFLSAASEFKPGKAIRGGIPIIFPQFDRLGPLQKHGFARLLRWDTVPDACRPDQASATFILHDSEATHSVWPYSFQAEVKVAIGGNRLSVCLTVKNTGNEPFTFTTALHTYCRVANILTTTVDGLSGIRYLDTRQTPWIEGIEGNTPVNFPDEFDRNYHAAPRTVRLCTPEQIISVESEGFPDLVLWNPGPLLSASLKDMEPNGYQRFVCIEAAAIEKPVKLASGSCWCGTQTLIAEV